MSMWFQFSSQKYANYGCRQNQCCPNPAIFWGCYWQKGLEQTSVGWVVHDGKRTAPRKYAHVVRGGNYLLGVMFPAIYVCYADFWQLLWPSYACRFSNRRKLLRSGEDACWQWLEPLWMKEDTVRGKFSRRFASAFWIVSLTGTAHSETCCFGSPAISQRQELIKKE